MAGSTEQILQPSPNGGRNTRVLPVDPSKIGEFTFTSPEESFLGDWDLRLSKTTDAAHLSAAATMLRSSNVPIAFPTETVYGLGADATRSSAVLGIYAAKQRPPDNPLIVHISSLSQLRGLLRRPLANSSIICERPTDPIPLIYHSLISRFWPGPLTILLPLPAPNPLAPQVSASLPTFGVRMPSSPLALALIHLAGVPLAAPSANVSTRPSPTTAAHVLEDLSGRVDMILDGGPCAIGVESTVVDGLADPPVILRPGGVSIEMLRGCPGWEGVRVGYRDYADGEVPRAPGMKYRHYSPRARVSLIEGQLDMELVKSYALKSKSIGILRTKNWTKDLLEERKADAKARGPIVTKYNKTHINGTTLVVAERILDGKSIGDVLPSSAPLSPPVPLACYLKIMLDERSGSQATDVWDIGLGKDTAHIARGLFSALRELDQKGVDVIFVEGINDGEGDAAAAVMNRLRKAAEIEIKA